MSKTSFFKKAALPVLVAAAIGGILILSCNDLQQGAGKSSVQLRSSADPQAASDTCNCYKAAPQPGTSCDSIKVITWQGSCINTTTIYSLYEDNSSQMGEYLALGAAAANDLRRILIEIDLRGIVDSLCLNPNISRVEPFDSVYLTLYTVPDVPGVDYTDLTRIFRLGQLTSEWVMDSYDGALPDAATTLKSGVAANQGATWNDRDADIPTTWGTPGGDYDHPSATPRNLPMTGTGIDSVVFVCHRPQPDNPPMKTTVGGWISGAFDNYGWVIMADSAQVAAGLYKPMVFYSSYYKANPSLCPKLTMYFTKGENRADLPSECATISFIPVPAGPEPKWLE